jgi:predicted DNA-binding transcriptional regulator AlpA
VPIINEVLDEDPHLNRDQRRAKKSAGHGGTKKAAWRITEFAEAIGCSRAQVYILINRGLIPTRKLGKVRLILTSPAEFLRNLPSE